MKMLTVFGILTIVFTSCGILTSQETQQERLRLIAAYNEARQKHNPEKIKRAVKDLLVGEWQYVGLEVEGGAVSVKGQESTPQQVLKSAPSFVQQLSKSATDKAAAPTAPEQIEELDSPKPKTDEQTTPENAHRLQSIEVTDEKSRQQILGAKAALVASTRKNLTIKFFEDRGSYHYTGNNQGKRVTGQCYVTTKRYGDDPFPYVRFNQRTGPDMLEFLFGSEPIKQIAAKQKQRRAAMRQKGARRAAAKKTSYTIASLAGITVTEDRLYLVLYGDMKLTPKGWMRIGGLRCTFKRIEEK